MGDKIHHIFIHFSERKEWMNEFVKWMWERQNYILNHLMQYSLFFPYLDLKSLTLKQVASCLNCCSRFSFLHIFEWNNILYVQNSENSGFCVRTALFPMENRFVNAMLQSQSHSQLQFETFVICYERRERQTQTCTAYIHSNLESTIA